MVKLAVKYSKMSLFALFPKINIFHFWEVSIYKSVFIILGKLYNLNPCGFRGFANF